MLPFALTIFTGAFLLFQVQPLIGKYILPWFGGGPGVWTTCLLFFQTAAARRLRLCALLLDVVQAPLSKCHRASGAAGAVARAAPDHTVREAGSTQVDGDPNVRILLLLAATIGLPYFVLSSTGPLMQQWFSQTNPGVSPYRLYALSNVGSLLALLSYPLYFEVKFPRQTQATMWSVGLGLFVMFCGYCAWMLWRKCARA